MFTYLLTAIVGRHSVRTGACVTSFNIQAVINRDKLKCTGHRTDYLWDWSFRATRCLAYIAECGRTCPAVPLELADGVCIYRMAISPFSGEERNRRIGDLNGSFEREIMCASRQQWKQSDSDLDSDRHTLDGGVLSSVYTASNHRWTQSLQ